MGAKATTTEPLRITTKPFDSTPRMLPPFTTEATFIATAEAFHAMKEDYDRAIADYNEAIRLNPNYAEAFDDRGLAYALKGQHDRALADFSEAIPSKNASAFINRGLVYGSKNENDRAIADYNEAIRLDPKYANAYCNRGWAKLRAVMRISRKLGS